MMDRYDAESEGGCGGRVDGLHENFCPDCPLRNFMDCDFAGEIIDAAFRNFDWDRSSLDPDDTAETYGVIAATPLDGITVEASSAGSYGTDDNLFARAIIGCYERQGI